MPDAPQEIYCLGNLEALQIPGLGIVGSRQASKEGVATAAYFAKAVVKQGLMVISGLAEGIDSAAHQGALQGQDADGQASGDGPARVPDLLGRAVDGVPAVVGPEHGDQGQGLEQVGSSDGGDDADAGAHRMADEHHLGHVDL